MMFLRSRSVSFSCFLLKSGLLFGFAYATDPKHPSPLGVVIQKTLPNWDLGSSMMISTCASYASPRDHCMNKQTLRPRSEGSIGIKCGISCPACFRRASVNRPCASVGRSWASCSPAVPKRPTPLDRELLWGKASSIPTALSCQVQR